MAFILSPLITVNKRLLKPYDIAVQHKYMLAERKIDVRSVGLFAHIFSGRPEDQQRHENKPDVEP